MDERDEERYQRDAMDEDTDSTSHDGHSHATTAGGAAAGAVTGGVIGLAGGPIGAAVGAVGGAIVGAAAERIMHHDDDSERTKMGLDNDKDSNPLIENRDRLATDGTTQMSSGTADSGGRMQLREEELHARTTPVQTGEVTLEKDIVSEQRTLEVPVTREEVQIERHPVDRRPADMPISDTERSSIDMPVHSEQVSVEKQPVVYEEVGIGKRQVTDTQDVNATVRREEVRVRKDGDTPMTGGDRTSD